jgi:DNA-binding transcriptional LysR family regulator
VLFASACGIPRDPDGTLDRVTGGTLRVGASPHDGLVIVDDGVVSGSLATLIEGFATDRDAEIDWTVDSEEGLVDRLERGSLDLAIGGMTDATPWADRVGVTRGYPDLPGSAGSNVVVLLPMGENALQAALETYLDREARP